MPAFEVLLHDKAAHRVTDQNRRRRKGVDRLFEILHEIGEAREAKPFFSFALAVPPKAHCVRREAELRKISEKMFVPAPGAVPRPMNKKKWGGVSRSGWSP